MCADFEHLIEQGFVDVDTINGELVGYIVMFKCSESASDTNACLFILNIAVLPEIAGLNVGTKLMKNAESVGRAQSFPCLRLYTNLKNDKKSG